jgi:hypothetical protein
MVDGPVKAVTSAKAGVRIDHKVLIILDSSFRRNDERKFPETFYKPTIINHYKKRRRWGQGGKG